MVKANGPVGGRVAGEAEVVGAAGVAIPPPRPKSNLRNQLSGGPVSVRILQTEIRAARCLNRKMNTSMNWMPILPRSMMSWTTMPMSWRSHLLPVGNDLARSVARFPLGTMQLVLSSIRICNRVLNENLRVGMARAIVAAAEVVRGVVVALRKGTATCFRLLPSKNRVGD